MITTSTKPDTAQSWFGRAFEYVRRYGRWGLLVLGIGAVIALVYHVGLDKLWSVLVLAGPWFPLIIILEGTWVFFEGLSLLVLYGQHARHVPVRDWVRSMMTHYMTMVLLPIGRAGAEVARATLLSRHVGGQRAAAGGVQMQATVLLANAAICIPCIWAAHKVVGLSGLVLFLIGNAVVTAFMGAGLYLVTRKARLGGWLGKRFQRMAHWGPELDSVLREPRRHYWLALLICVGGRSIQAFEYGLILFAVGGAFTLDGALIAEGIHLVGSGLGDVVPNQVGVSEGAYRIFAHALGLAATPERALAIALVARVAIFTVAGSCFAVLQLTKPLQAD